MWKLGKGVTKKPVANATGHPTAHISGCGRWRCRRGWHAATATHGGSLATPRNSTNFLGQAGETGISVNQKHLFVHKSYIYIYIYILIYTLNFINLFMFLFIVNSCIIIMYVHVCIYIYYYMHVYVYMHICTYIILFLLYINLLSFWLPNWTLFQITEPSFMVEGNFR